MDTDRMVWYACYGSNLLKSRFMCYIKGGLIPGNRRQERGCKDTRDPQKSAPLIIKHELFFGYHAEKWDGSGVAFINPEKTNTSVTFGRMYLVSEERFWDIVRQENGLPDNAAIQVNRDELMKNRSTVVFHDNYYGRILLLGAYEGIPVYTFTCVEVSAVERSKAVGNCYQVIGDGLKEVYGFSDRQISEYIQHSKPALPYDSTLAAL